ncbi:hypothetical protein [Brevibacillus thermoruber]|uniref:hypothetical protein n=1 Tax=Brevibacillus thermoruber TaxID=33942 RepID=UPI00055599C0|nr:hypothetical protein [Brevibacillus thermoruber]
MPEVKRDAAADLALCEEATPGKWEGKHAIQPYISVFTGVVEEVIATTYTRGNMRFIAESRTALPHWIKRAVAAEAEVERMQKEAEAIRYVVDMLDTGDPQQRRARLHLLDVIKRMEKA